MKKIKKQNQASGTPVGINSIVRFFAIAILIFGIALASEGCYAIYRAADDKRPANMPTVTIERVNDKAILSVKHSVEISKISYHWNNGEETVLPIGDLMAREEITLLNYDSTLYITIEDINKKQVNYQKEYLLTGVDITKPTIDEPKVEDGNDKMLLVVRDETAIASLTYYWENEPPVTIRAGEENQTEISQEVTLTPGSKKITIIAEDKNGNTEELEKEILITTSIPEMYVLLEKDEIIIQAKDKDGVKDIVVNLNGQVSSARDINLQDVKVGPLKLREGINTISVEVTNVNGYTKRAATEITYPQ